MHELPHGLLLQRRRHDRVAPLPGRLVRPLHQRPDLLVRHLPTGMLFGQSSDSLWTIVGWCNGLTLAPGLVLRSGQHGPHRLPGEHVQHRVRRPELDYMPVQLLLDLWLAYDWSNRSLEYRTCPYGYICGEACYSPMATCPAGYYCDKVSAAYPKICHVACPGSM